jgi:phage FluMu protein Com
MGWSYLAVGFVLIVFGVMALYEGGFSFHGVFGPISKLTAIGIIVFGVIMMRSGYKNVTSDNAPQKRDKFLKCNRCGHVYHFHEVQNKKCPKCSEDVENIEGFFERHPEFRENKDK